MKLTAAVVRSAGIPPGKSEAIFFDDDVPGFGLRVREAGSRSFVFQYKLGSKRRRMALGIATALNFGGVRKTAEQLYARVKLGQDPAGEKNHARLKATETFEAVARQHLDDKRKEMRPRSFAQVERHLLKHAKALHKLQFEKISRQDIAACVRSVRENSGIPNGNRVSSSRPAGSRTPGAGRARAFPRTRLNSWPKVAQTSLGQSSRPAVFGGK